MKRILLLLFFYLTFSSESFAQWQTVFDSTDYSFSGIFFINNDTGFVAGYHSGNGYYGGTIMRTMNGGLTWDKTYQLPNILSIQFVNDSVGFAGGQDCQIYRTTNMGNTWNFVGEVLTLGDLSSLYFINPQIGYATLFNGGIRKTVNGGTSWVGLFGSAGRSYFPGTAKFTFVDSLTGYVTHSYHGMFTTNQGSAISKTMGGGATWTDLPIPSNFYPYSCFFFDSLSGFAVGYHGKISKTTDGGLTWTTPDSLCPDPLYDVAFVNDSIGYISGGFNVYEDNFPNGIIFKTKNRGITWEVMNTYSDGLTKLHFPSDSIGYAVGMNGIILKLTSANHANVSVQTLTNSREKLTVFPNPANNSITVNLNRGKKILIVNLLGEIVLEKSFLPDSNRKAEFDISFLSSGIYFIKTDFEIVKFVKQ
ncbi:MAG: hypothetical protein A3F72_04065 [Bacteroidetes bacterium RIFCSPLOWO2_12_FULL_35_15]|nr:MAG: hypothetical protein A3F72_04065 [Bacteroidetes bacterium RIFCSPLOWO2_12_FULL_35_15]